MNASKVDPRSNVRLLLVCAALVALIAVTATYVRGNDNAPGDSSNGTPGRAGQLTPSPQEADDDAPDLYDDGCQVGPDDAELLDCSYGASADEATATVAVVGDSKVGQWTPALQKLAADRGWRVLIYTKSTCPGINIPVTKGGEEYTSCTEFNKRVTAALRANPVDLILTDSATDNAVVPGSPDPSAEVRNRTFVDGLKTTWATWVDDGNRVAVISDTPSPIRNGDDLDVPACVERNTTNLDACSYDRAAGIEESGRETQMRAVDEAQATDVSTALTGQKVPDASEEDLFWIDPLPLICEVKVCPAVQCNILLYRDGSHLTSTFIESLTDRIGSAATAIGLP